MTKHGGRQRERVRWRLGIQKKRTVVLILSVTTVITLKTTKKRVFFFRRMEWIVLLVRRLSKIALVSRPRLGMNVRIGWECSAIGKLQVNAFFL